MIPATAKPDPVPPRVARTPQTNDAEDDGDDRRGQPDDHDERDPAGDHAGDAAHHGGNRHAVSLAPGRLDRQSVDEALAAGRHVSGPDLAVVEAQLVAAGRVGIPPAHGADPRRTLRDVELVLIRHGQPEWVREGLNVVDPPLTDLGHRQAAALAEALSSEHFDEVLVSPLVRARETAAPLLESLGRSEDIDLWLEEIRDPNWHGTPAEHAAEAYEELRSRPSLDRWRGLPGGEDIREFVQRIRLGAEKFLQERGVVQVESELPVWQIEEPGRRIGLVAHNGTNSIVICHLLGLPPTPWEWERLVLRHASVSRLEAIPLGDGYTFSLTALSDVEHIPVADRTR